VNITRAAIEKSRITSVVLLVILAAGWQAFNELPRAEDPGFIIRMAQVMTIFPGASPDRVEKLVTDRLEKAIQEIPEVDFIASTSKTGLSVIMVNVKESHKKMRPIWDSLRRKVERETPNLPQGAFKPSVNDEFGDVFGILLSVTSDGYSYAGLKEVADSMRDELLNLPDAAKVDIYGVQDERVFLEYNTARLVEAGLSPLQLSQILTSQNIVIPGGSVHLGDERIDIEPSGNFGSVEEIANSVIALPKARAVVYLKDLVQVSRGYRDPPRTKVHTSDGTALVNSKKYNFPYAKPATAGLVLGISMRKGGKLTDLGDQVETLLTRFREAYPLGIQVNKAMFQPRDVQLVVDNFTTSLMQAIVIVMIAMLLFLGMRTGLVVSALIPSAIMASLAIMQVLGIGLDQISLAALIIALGMLVDNGVVMAESTMVSMAEGKTAKEAAISSANELRIPLLTSSLTTSAAFLPIFMAKSATGEYTASLFKVVTIALLSSWVLSLTMTPLLCTWLLKVKPKQISQTFSTRFYRYYRGFLLLFLRRPLFTLLIILATFGGVMTLFAHVPKKFFPPSDRPTFEVEVSMPVGTAIETTTHTVKLIERELRKTYQIGQHRKLGVVGWTAFIGAGGPRYYLSANIEPPNPAYALMLVSHTGRDGMDETMDGLRRWALDAFPGAKVDVKPRALGPPVRFPVSVRLQGKEAGALFELAEKVKTQLRTDPAVNNVSDDWGMRSKKLVVEIDQPRARRAGVSSQDVAVSLQTHFTGLEVTQYREREKVIPVIMRSVAADREDIGKLQTLNVYSQTTGQSVSLQQIADVKLVWEPSKIQRRNRNLTITVNATMRPGALASTTTAKIKGWLVEDAKNWPIGYRFENAGEAEETAKANESINEQLPFAGFVIILLLVWQFNSLRRPLIIFVTLPLGMIGVVLGLLITKSYFGFMTFLGVISLFGIVINNAIVLLDRIKIEIEDNHLEPARAIVQAAQARLRPILLTTATTIAGLIPLWLGSSPMFVPMAIAIIFGLAFATVLTLGAVPTMYAILFRVKFKGFSW
jgi:multidrug efflux pump